MDAGEAGARRFIKLPENWLFEECWLTDLPPGEPPEPRAKSTRRRRDKAPAGEKLKARCEVCARNFRTSDFGEMRCPSCRRPKEPRRGTPDWVRDDDDLFRREQEDFARQHAKRRHPSSTPPRDDVIIVDEPE